MSVLEELIVLAGISLDIFAVMECQGSLIAKVQKKHLAIICSILVIGQVLALGIGNFLLFVL